MLAAWRIRLALKGMPLRAGMRVAESLVAADWLHPSALETALGALGSLRHRTTAEPFDAVFTDLAMPGMSGWELARAVTQLNADVPVFVVTGFGVEVPPAELADHGVRAVLTKPLGLQETQALLATLRPPR